MNKAQELVKTVEMYYGGNIHQVVGYLQGMLNTFENEYKSAEYIFQHHIDSLKNDKYVAGK